MKKFFFVVLLMVMCFNVVFAENSSSNSRIEINLPSRTLSLYADDVKIREYPVCIGKGATQTPQGQYNVVYKTIDPYWLNEGVLVPPGPQNPLGIRWIGMTKSLGIHGNNKPESIGTSASLGCIRMYNRDVKELYELVPSGTQVMIGYDRVSIFEDGYGRDNAVVIYPDCYNEGHKNEKKLYEEIDNAVLDTALKDKAKKLLWSRQSKVIAVSSGIGVFLNEAPVTCDAFFENSSLYVNCFAARDAFGLTAELAGIYDIETREKGEQVYINLSQTVKQLGGKLSFDAKTSNAYIDMKIIKMNRTFLDINRGNYDREDLIALEKFEKLGYACEQDAVDIRFLDRELVKVVRNSKSYVSAESLASAVEGSRRSNPLSRSVDIMIPPYIKAGERYFKTRCIDGGLVLDEESAELIRNITGTTVEVFESKTVRSGEYIELDLFLEDYDYRTNEYCTMIEILQKEN